MDSHLSKFFYTTFIKQINNFRIDKKLLEFAFINSFDVNCNYGKYSLLNHACYKQDFESVKLLIEYGADIECKSDINSTPIMFSCEASDENTVKFLLEKGAKIDVLNNFGYSPLSYACWQNNENIVKLLITKSVLTINNEHNNGRTPLIHACDNNNENIVKILLKYGAKKDHKNKDGKMAVEFTTNESIKALLTPPPSKQDKLKAIVTAIEEFLET